MQDAFNEAESRLFWQISGELNHAIRENDGTVDASVEIAMLVEEAENMLQNTDNEVIRKRCRDLLAKTRRPMTGTAG